MPHPGCVVSWNGDPPPGVGPVESLVDAVCFGTVAPSATGEQVASFVAAAEGLGDNVVYSVGFPPAVCAGVCIAFEDEGAGAFPFLGA